MPDDQTTGDKMRLERPDFKKALLKARLSGDFSEITYENYARHSKPAFFKIVKPSEEKMQKMNTVRDFCIENGTQIPYDVQNFFKSIDDLGGVLVEVRLKEHEYLCKTYTTSSHDDAIGYVVL